MTASELVRTSSSLHFIILANGRLSLLTPDGELTRTGLTPYPIDSARLGHGVPLYVTGELIRFGLPLLLLTRLLDENIVLVILA